MICIHMDFNVTSHKYKGLRYKIILYKIAEYCATVSQTRSEDHVVTAAFFSHRIPQIQWILNEEQRSSQRLCEHARLWARHCLTLSKGGPVFCSLAARSGDGLPDLRHHAAGVAVWKRGTCDLRSRSACVLLCEHHAREARWDCQPFNCPLNGQWLGWHRRAAADKPLWHISPSNHICFQ